MRVSTYKRMLRGIERHPWRVGIGSILTGSTIGTAMGQLARFHSEARMADLLERAQRGDKAAAQELAHLEHQLELQQTLSGLTGTIGSAGLYGYLGGGARKSTMSKLLHNKAVLGGLGAGALGIGGAGLYLHNRGNRKKGEFEGGETMYDDIYDPYYDPYMTKEAGLSTKKILGLGALGVGGAGGLYALIRRLRRSRAAKGVKGYFERAREMVAAHPYRTALGAAGLAGLGVGGYLYSRRHNGAYGLPKTSEFDKYAGISPKSVIRWIKSHPLQTLAALGLAGGGAYGGSRLLRARRAAREGKRLIGKVRTGLRKARGIAAAHPYRTALGAAGLAGLGAGAYAYSRRNRR